MSINNSLEKARITPWQSRDNTPHESKNHETPDALFEEQLRLFFRFQPTALSANFLCSMLFVAILHRTAPAVLLGSWVALFAALLAIRYTIAQKFPGDTHDASTLREWAVKAYAGVIVTGAFWGLGAALMSYQLSPSQEIAIPLLIFGLSAGTVATLSPIRCGALLFTVPAVTPLMFHFMAQHSETGVSLAAASFVFVATMVFISNRAHRATLESIRIRFENDELIARITETNEKFTKLAEASFDGIVIYRRDGIVLEANGALAELLGYQPHELAGMSALDLVAEKERPMITERLQSLDNATIETTLLTKDGTLIAVEARCRDIEYRGHAARVTSIRDLSALKEVHQERRRQLDFLHALLETIPNPVFYKNTKGVYLGCNTAFELYLRKSRNQIIGRTASDLAPPDLAEIYRRKDQELFDNPGVQVYESEVFGAKGKRNVIFYKATFNSSPDGPVGGLIGVIMDITERKRAEEALRESEEKYRGVFETAADIIHVLSPDGTIEAISPSVEAITGYRPEERIGVNMAEMMRRIIHPDDVAPLAESFRQALDGKLAKVELRIRRKDGTEAVTENRSWPLVKDGKVAKIIGIARDITLRRKQEADLKILGDAIRESGEVVVITDGNGVIQYVNPAVERVTGYKPEEMIGGIPNRLKSGKHTQEFYREMWGTIKSGSVWKGMMINRKKSGDLYHEEMTISPIKDASGAVTHFVAIKRDVTARINAEEEILRAMELAQEANRLKDKFLSIAAHDLRSPFTAILGFLRILHKDDVNPLTPAQADLAGRAIHGAEGLLKMIDEILDMGNAQSGKLEMNKDVFNASELAKSVIGELAHMAASKKITVKNMVQDGVRFRTDLRLMRIVLRNILSNALKFTAAGGSVEIFSPDGGGAAIGVRDTGVGMDEDKLARIFSHEGKTSTAGTSGEKGSGLGLPFCNDIVMFLGGRIAVESVPGKGSVFTVTLPHWS